MTIRLRLTLYWAAVLAAIIVAAAIAVDQLFASRQRSALEIALAEEADTTAEELHHAPAAVAPKIVERLSHETDIAPGRRVRLVTSAGVIADFGDSHTIPPTLASACPATKMMTSSDGARFAVVPLTLGGTRACLENGVSTALIAESIAHLRTSLFLMAPALLLFCVAGGYWLAGRALEPIESLNSALAGIGPGNLSSRLQVGPTGDEVARLSAVINGLLDRIER
ncbi:MAG TPA: HAMP domain-containing protein, partial [Candidatus Binataceae bacterium]|nr:HAMP domain-containing protein [Candidatus Binataceae bacterium]